MRETSENVTYRPGRWPAAGLPSLSLLGPPGALLGHRKRAPSAGILRLCSHNLETGFTPEVPGTCSLTVFRPLLTVTSSEAPSHCHIESPPTLALHCALLCFLTLFTACRYFIIFPWSRAPVSYKDISLLKAGILCINFARHEVHGNPRCLIHCRLRNCVE